MEAAAGLERTLVAARNIAAALQSIPLEELRFRTLGMLVVGIGVVNEDGEVLGSRQLDMGNSGLG